MQTRNTLAAIDDHECHSHRYGEDHGGEWFAHPLFDTLTDVLEFAEEYHFTHLWIAPGSSISTLLSRDMFPSQTWVISALYQNKKHDRYSFLSARRPGARHEESIYIGFPEFSAWPWEGDSDPLTLLKTVTWLEDALGLPLEWTAPHMSMAYVRKLNESRWSWLAPLTIDIEKETPGFSYDACAIDLHWPPHGQQLPIPEGATHEIVIDGNSAFAAGMTSLNIGEGNPKRTSSDFPYDGKRPGFWRVDVTVPGQCWYAQGLWDMMVDFEDRRWMTTDLVEQCRRSGMLVKVLGGWYWEKYHQTLRSSAEGLWALRSKWRPVKDKSAAHGNVYEALRIVLKAIQGKFGDTDNSQARFRRRDIWASVSAKNVARMMYHIEKIHREYGLLPHGIKVDELRYYTNNPHIFDSMLGTEKLGGFKLVEVREL